MLMWTPDQAGSCYYVIFIIFEVSYSKIVSLFFPIFFSWIKRGEIETHAGPYLGSMKKGQRLLKGPLDTFMQFHKVGLRINNI